MRQEWRRDDAVNAIDQARNTRPHPFRSMKVPNAKRNMEYKSTIGNERNGKERLIGKVWECPNCHS